MEAKLPGGLSEESTENKMVELKQYIKEVFPGAQHREKFGDRVIFEVPTSNIESLSQTFTTLEKGERSKYFSVKTEILALFLFKQVDTNVS